MAEHAAPPPHQPNREPNREPSLDPEIAAAQLTDWQRQFRDQLAPLHAQIRDLDQNIQLYRELGNDHQMAATQLHRQELMDRRRELIEAVPAAHYRESVAVRQQLGVTMGGDTGSSSAAAA